MLIFVMWLFSLLIFIGVFILRKKAPELPRPYKVPLYPIVPIIAILGAIFILGMTMMTQTKLALIGIGVTLIGIPVYYQKKKKTLRRVKIFQQQTEKVRTRSSRSSCFFLFIICQIKLDKSSL